MGNIMDKIEEKELAFSPEALARIEKARNMPIVFDKDCPETTPERAIKFRRVNPPKGNRA